MGLWSRLQAAWVELRGGTGEVSFEDPLLQAPEHALLAAQVQQMFDKAGPMN